MNKSTLKKLFKIAQENMVALENRKDFEQHWNDEEDFLDVSVWSIENALIKAYELGKKEASKKA